MGCVSTNTQHAKPTPTTTPPPDPNPKIVSSNTSHPDLNINDSHELNSRRLRATEQTFGDIKKNIEYDKNQSNQSLAPEAYQIDHSSADTKMNGSSGMIKMSHGSAGFGIGSADSGTIIHANDHNNPEQTNQKIKWSNKIDNNQPQVSEYINPHINSLMPSYINKTNLDQEINNTHLAIVSNVDKVKANNPNQISAVILPKARLDPSALSWLGEVAKENYVVTYQMLKVPRIELRLS